MNESTVTTIVALLLSVQLLYLYELLFLKVTIKEIFFPAVAFEGDPDAHATLDKAG